MKSILFSGVHGVGKGFFLEKVNKEIDGYDIFTASSLIEKYKPATDAGYKRVSNVKGNQDVLIAAIKEAQHGEEKSFILDGHLCILDSVGNAVRIPETFFSEAQIEGIIILQDNPEMILERIYKRDADKISLESIEEMQNEELRYAQELKKLYKIPYVVVTHECTEIEFKEVIRGLGGENIE